MLDERSADVLVVTDAVAMDAGIYQRKRQVSACGSVTLPPDLGHSVEDSRLNLWPVFKHSRMGKSRYCGADKVLAMEKGYLLWQSQLPGQLFKSRIGTE